MFVILFASRMLFQGRDFPFHHFLSSCFVIIALQTGWNKHYSTQFYFCMPSSRHLLILAHNSMLPHMELNYWFQYNLAYYMIFGKIIELNISRILSSGKQLHIARWKLTDVSEWSISLIFRAYEWVKQKVSMQERARRAYFMLLSCMTFFLTLMMEIIWSIETSVDFHRNCKVLYPRKIELFILSAMSISLTN
jgi:hypothetical protein